VLVINLPLVLVEEDIVSNLNLLELYIENGIRIGNSKKSENAELVG